MECKKIDTREAPTEDMGGEYGKSKQLQVTALQKDAPGGILALNQPDSGLGPKRCYFRECNSFERER